MFLKDHSGGSVFQQYCWKDWKETIKLKIIFITHKQVTHLEYIKNSIMNKKKTIEKLIKYLTLTSQKEIYLANKHGKILNFLSSEGKAN